MKSIIRKLFIFILTLSISMSPLMVSADTGGNGTGEGTTAGGLAIVNGPSANKQFWLLSIHDGTGAIKSSVVLLKTKDIEYDLEYIYTRPEHGSVAPSEVRTGSDFGWSFSMDGAGRGTAVKNWMLSMDDNGQPNAYTMIENLWGSDMAEQWVDNKWYLCLEDGIWCNVYINGQNTGISFAGTSYGWGLLLNNIAGNDYKGDALINRYTNNILPNSSKLQFSQTGVNAPTNSGKITSANMLNEGYGMIILWAGETANPAGAIRVIKNYKEKLPSGEYKDNGCVQTSISTTNFTINDESGYKVVG